MPKFTLTLTVNTVSGLQVEVDRFNAATRSALTLDEWLHLHLKEVAVAPALSAAITQLRDTQQAAAELALTTAINNTRQALIDAL